MSYTTTYQLFRTKVNALSEHRNGWGSAPLVWTYLEEKYLPKIEYSRMAMGRMQEVWDLYKDPRLAEHERFALYATYDYSYCEREHLSRGADLLDTFAAEAAAALPSHVNHWSRIAADYRNAGRDGRMLGVCIGATSVCDVWEGYPRHTKTPWAIFATLAADAA